MKTQLKSRLLIVAVLFIVFTGCEKNAVPVAKNDPQNLVMDKISGAIQISDNAAGATQVSGVGFYAAIGECTSSLGQGSSYAVRMTGDLEGCLYTFIDKFGCSPSGTYREEGRELFIGTYKGEPGSFTTTYKFEAKYEGCAEDGVPLGAEIKGRCQHPIVKGSGEGVFEGVTGRLDLKDDIEAGNFPYRGHIKF